MSIIEQAKLMNEVHQSNPLTHIIGEGISKCSIQRWRVHLKEHSIPKFDYPMIAVQIAGPAKIYRTNGNNILSSDYVMSGDLAIVPAQEELSWSINGEVDIAVLLFENTSTCKNIQSVYQNIQKQKQNSNHVGSFANSYVLAICNHLLNIFDDPSFDTSSHDYINTVLRALEMYLTSHLGKENTPFGYSGKSLSHPVSQTLKRLSYDIGETIRISEIADQLNISQAFLTRKFKYELGVSPHQYLLLLRVKRVKQFLMETDISISTIAVETGFYSQAHMSHHFKRIVGMTPLKFRQHSKNKIPRLN